MNISEICKKRIIKSISEETPILIPSFSSKGFLMIKDIFEATSNFITDYSLLSAYDIYYNNFDSTDIYISDVLFIDSGGYETKEYTDIFETPIITASIKPWDENLYNGIIQSLKHHSKIVVVTYDDKDNDDIVKQLSNALHLKKTTTEFAIDFLLKPQPKEDFIDIDVIKEYSDSLSEFDIIGITDKELGDTLIERCSTLLKLRLVINSVDSSIPIHVFGCIDPQSILLYSLCGADIFDGLAWLRYDFNYNPCSYINQTSITENIYDITDFELCLYVWERNLSLLKQMNNTLNRFNLEYDFDIIRQLKCYQPAVDDIIKQLDIIL